MYETFDPSLLPEILLTLESNWADARAARNHEVIPYAATLKAVLDNTTAVMPGLKERNRSQTINLAWLSACQGEANYKTGQWLKGYPCDFSGWEIGSNRQKISINSVVDTAFAVPLRLYDNMFTPDQIFQMAYSRAIKLVLEKTNSVCIGKIAAYSGYNKYHLGMGVDGGAGPTSWMLTKVPYRNMYPQSLSSYLRTAARVNKMVNPAIVAGGAFETSEYVDGSAERMRFGALDIYSDLESFPENDLENDFFVFSRGAIAFVNYYDYDLGGMFQPEPLPGQMHFAAALPSAYSVGGAPLVVDITRKRLNREFVLREGLQSEFTADNRCELYDVYNIELKFEILLNPLSCVDENITGVLHFQSDDTLDMFYSPTAAQAVVQVATL